MNFKIRRAAKEDCKDISRMIMDLAIYEKMPDQVKISHEAVLCYSEIGKKKQCARLQLSALEWNTPSRDFYAAKGAQDLTVTEGWHAIRFDGQSLDNLANEAPKD
ncbi:diamine acetyltransferase 2-like [Neolamprologus brichardi]|uniref:diamine acetyltransferase 2-like n=1 Tax=Neolamprologus brichardi TaxID=32507 RepID=UPI0003EBFCB5|nr:diamine acetyltransferase 2-like [Neolamprologus brichardi]